MNLQPFDVENEELRASMVCVRRYAEAIMKAPAQPHYTDHSISHLDRILVLISDCLSKNYDCERLTDEEKYILFCAVMLHDIGMEDESAEPDAMSRRDSHQSMAADRIRNEWSTIGIREPYVNFVAKIAESHRGDFAGIPKEEVFGSARKVRTALLAMLMFLGDELDLSYERVSPEKWEYLDLSTVTKLHYFQHYYTQGIGVLEGGKLVLRFRYPPTRTEQYHELFGKAVTKKLLNSLTRIAVPLSDQYRFFISLDERDVGYAADPSLRLVPPDDYERMFEIAIGISNYSRIRGKNFDDMRGTSDPKKFYMGDVQWEDIVDGLDIEREQYSVIRAELGSLHLESCKSQKAVGLLIAGEAGSGKSTLLKRLALDLSRDRDLGDVELLWLPEDSSFHYVQLRQFFLSYQKPLIVFVDGTRIYDTVEGMRRQIPADGGAVPLVVVCASRLNEWESAGGKLLSFAVLKLVVLSQLVMAEMYRLLTALEKHDQLYELKQLSQRQRLEQLRRSNGYLLVAMLEATRGKRFTDIVLDEYNNLKSKHEEAAKAYQYICLFYKYGVLLPQSLLITLCDCAGRDDFEQMVLSHTKLVIVVHPDTRFGIKYRPRHQVIAANLIDNLTKDKGLRDELRTIAVVTRKIQSTIRQERFVLIEFIESTIKELQRAPSANYNERLADIAKFCEDNDQRIFLHQACACDEKDISYLVKWSSIYRQLRCKNLRIRVLRDLNRIEPHNSTTCWHLGRELLSTRVASEDPEKIAGLFAISFQAGNRHLDFLITFLEFCARTGLSEVIDNIMGGIGELRATTPEEDAIKRKIELLLEGFRINRDNTKLADEMGTLLANIRATEGLTASEQLYYIDTFETQDPKSGLDIVERYLSTVDVRPKSALLRAARFAARLPREAEKAIGYYRELYEKHIKPKPQKEDYEIVYEYGRLLARHRPPNKYVVFEVLRIAISLKENDLHPYIDLASAAMDYGEKKLAESTCKKGLSVAQRLGKFHDREAAILRDILGQIET